jgi:hypothetical protein
MATRLWGGNECSVLAMIRSLAIADLSLCSDRKEIIRYLDESSMVMAHAFMDTKKEIEKRGGNVHIFGPSIMPSKMKS